MSVWLALHLHWLSVFHWQDKIAILVIAIVLQNGSELKSAEVNNWPLISLHQSRQEKVIKLHIHRIFSITSEKSRLSLAWLNCLCITFPQSNHCLQKSFQPNTFKGRFSFACPDTMDTLMKESNRRNYFDVNFYWKNTYRVKNIS